MKTIILLSCCKQKLNKKAPARELYQSTGFKKSLRYAQSLHPDLILILSAKHHIVTLDQELEPYDECLNTKSLSEKKEWARICLYQLSKISDLQNDKFIILAGKNYYSELIKGLKNYELPLENLKMGERLQWFDEHTEILKNENKPKIPKTAIIRCNNIHEFANSFERFTYPFDINKIPENGIYIFFEKGEKYNGMDRIVRVGTHTGQNNLRARLQQHLCNENKDRSIFRKNIGRALLNKDKDPFLEQWNWDLTSKANKDKYADKVDYKKLKETEERITSYMRENLSFIVMPVDIREERLKYEEFLIKSVSADKNCKPSETWLGNYSPVEKIRNSGMWLVNGLDLTSENSDSK